MELVCGWFTVRHVSASVLLSDLHIYWLKALHRSWTNACVWRLCRNSSCCLVKLRLGLQHKASEREEAAIAIVCSCLSHSKPRSWWSTVRRIGKRPDKAQSVPLSFPETLTCDVLLWCARVGFLGAARGTHTSLFAITEKKGKHGGFTQSATTKKRQLRYFFSRYSDSNVDLFPQFCENTNRTVYKGRIFGSFQNGILGIEHHVGRWARAMGGGMWLFWSACDRAGISRLARTVGKHTVVLMLSAVWTYSILWMNEDCVPKSSSEETCAEHARVSLYSTAQVNGCTVALFTNMLIGREMSRRIRAQLTSPKKITAPI